MKRILIIITTSFFMLSKNAGSQIQCRSLPPDNETEMSQIIIRKTTNTTNTRWQFVQQFESNIESDVDITHEYLTNKNGETYGAVFYINNYSNRDLNVQWRFQGSVNVRFSPTDSDIQFVTSKNRIMITTVTVIDRSKDWTSGKPQYKIL